MNGNQAKFLKHMKRKNFSDYKKSFEEMQEKCFDYLKNIKKFYKYSKKS